MPHYINKQNLNLHFKNSSKMDVASREYFFNLFQKKLISVLEQVLDDFSDGDYVSIDKLSIDCGNLEKVEDSKLVEAFHQATIEQIAKLGLDKNSTNSGVNGIRYKKEKILDIFLEQGTAVHPSFTENILQDKDLLKSKLKDRNFLYSKNSSNKINRLIHYLEPKQYLSVWEEVHPKVFSSHSLKNRFIKDANYVLDAAFGTEKKKTSSSRLYFFMHLVFMKEKASLSSVMVKSSLLSFVKKYANKSVDLKGIESNLSSFEEEKLEAQEKLNLELVLEKDTADKSINFLNYIEDKSENYFHLKQSLKSLSPDLLNDYIEKYLKSNKSIENNYFSFLYQKFYAKLKGAGFLNSDTYHRLTELRIKQLLSIKNKKPIASKDSLNSLNFLWNKYQKQLNSKNPKIVQSGLESRIEELSHFSPQSQKIKDFEHIEFDIKNYLKKHLSLVESTIFYAFKEANLEGVSPFEKENFLPSQSLDSVEERITEQVQRSIRKLSDEDLTAFKKALSVKLNAIKEPSVLVDSLLDNLNLNHLQGLEKASTLSENTLKSDLKKLKVAIHKDFGISKELSEALTLVEESISIENLSLAEKCQPFFKFLETNEQIKAKLIKEEAIPSQIRKLILAYDSKRLELQNQFKSIRKVLSITIKDKEQFSTIQNNLNELFGDESFHDSDWDDFFDSIDNLSLEELGWIQNKLSKELDEAQHLPLFSSLEVLENKKRNESIKQNEFLATWSPILKKHDFFSEEAEKQILYFYEKNHAFLEDYSITQYKTIISELWDSIILSFSESDKDKFLSLKRINGTLKKGLLKTTLIKSSEYNRLQKKFQLQVSTYRKRLEKEINSLKKSLLSLDLYEFTESFFTQFDTKLEDLFLLSLDDEKVETLLFDFWINLKLLFKPEENNYMDVLSYELTKTEMQNPIFLKLAKQEVRTLKEQEKRKTEITHSHLAQTTNPLFQVCRDYLKNGYSSKKVNFSQNIQSFIENNQMTDFLSYSSDMDANSLVLQMLIDELQIEELHHLFQQILENGEAKGLEKALFEQCFSIENKDFYAIYKDFCFYISSFSFNAKVLSHKDVSAWLKHRELHYEVSDLSLEWNRFHTKTNSVTASEGLELEETSSLKAFVKFLEHGEIGDKSFDELKSNLSDLVEGKSSEFLEVLKWIQKSNKASVRMIFLFPIDLIEFLFLKQDYLEQKNIQSLQTVEGALKQKYSFYKFENLKRKLYLHIFKNESKLHSKYFSLNLESWLESLETKSIDKEDLMKVFQSASEKKTKIFPVRTSVSVIKDLVDFFGNNGNKSLVEIQKELTLLLNQNYQQNIWAEFQKFLKLNPEAISDVVRWIPSDFIFSVLETKEGALYELRRTYKQLKSKENQPIFLNLVLSQAIFSVEKSFSEERIDSLWKLNFSARNTEIKEATSLAFVQIFEIRDFKIRKENFLAVLKNYDKNSLKILFTKKVLQEESFLKQFISDLDSDSIFEFIENTVFESKVPNHFKSNLRQTNQFAIAFDKRYFYDLLHAYVHRTSSFEFDLFNELWFSSQSELYPSLFDEIDSSFELDYFSDKIDFDFLETSLDLRTLSNEALTEYLNDLSLFSNHRLVFKNSELIVNHLVKESKGASFELIEHPLLKRWNVSLVKERFRRLLFRMFKSENDCLIREAIDKRIIQWKLEAFHQESFYTLEENLIDFVFGATNVESFLRENNFRSVTSLLIRPEIEVLKHLKELVLISATNFRVKELCLLQKSNFRKESQDSSDSDLIDLASDVKRMELGRQSEILKSLNLEALEIIIRSELSNVEISKEVLKVCVSKDFIASINSKYNDRYSLRIFYEKLFHFSNTLDEKSPSAEEVKALLLSFFSLELKRSLGEIEARFRREFPEYFTTKLDVNHEGIDYYNLQAKEQRGLDLVFHILEKNNYPEWAFETEITQDIFVKVQDVVLKNRKIRKLISEQYADEFASKIIKNSPSSFSKSLRDKLSHKYAGFITLVEELMSGLVEGNESNLVQIIILRNVLQAEIQLSTFFKNVCSELVEAIEGISSQRIENEIDKRIKEEGVKWNSLKLVLETGVPKLENQGSKTLIKPKGILQIDEVIRHYFNYLSLPKLYAKFYSFGDFVSQLENFSVSNSETFREIIRQKMKRYKQGDFQNLPLRVVEIFLASLFSQHYVSINKLDKDLNVLFQDLSKEYRISFFEEFRREEFLLKIYSNLNLDYVSGLDLLDAVLEQFAKENKLRKKNAFDLFTKLSSDKELHFISSCLLEYFSKHEKELMTDSSLNLDAEGLDAVSQEFEEIIRHENNQTHYASEIVSYPAAYTGIVFIWMELLPLLKDLNYISSEDNSFFPEKQNQFIFLLYYILTGELHTEEIEENNLFILKILAGYSPSYLPNFDATLEDHELEMVDSVLQKIVSIWSEELDLDLDLVMFREEILSRSGEVFDTEDTWFMAWDIKKKEEWFSYLSVSYAHVYLPWMTKNLEVIWQ